MHKEADMADDDDAPADKDDAPELQDNKNDDAAKWKSLSRKHEKEAKALADRLKEIEDKDKSESDRLTEKVAQLEKDLAKETARADRNEVALEKGLDITRAKRLTGTTREELEADADDLLTWTAGKSDDKPAPPGKPAVDLKGGGDPTEEPEVNVREVVDSIPRGF